MWCGCYGLQLSFFRLCSMLISLTGQEGLPLYRMEVSNLSLSPIDMEKIQQHFGGCFLHYNASSIEYVMISVILSIITIKIWLGHFKRISINKFCLIVD